MNHFLKFPDKSTSESILFNGEAKRYKNIDVIGVLHRLTGAVLTSAEGIEYPETEPLDGWHVNVLILPDEDADALEPYRVIPTNPVRVWA